MKTLYDKLMNYAFRALERRDMTSAEMRGKLMDRSRKILKVKELEDDDYSLIDDVVRRLEELDMIDDAQFIEHFINTKTLLNPQGKFGLRTKLRRKGIEPEFFEQMWEMLGVDERVALDRACENFIRKKGAIDSQKQKMRLMRYLASRGFNGGGIYMKITELGP